MTGIASAIISPIVGIFKKPKAPQVAAPLPQATPRRNAAISDALSSRQGSRANRRTGSNGAESSSSPKKQLLGS